MIRIVLADSEPIVCSGLAALLAGQSDMNVVGEAHDLSSALKLAEASQPDVLLTELELQGGSGLDVAARLAETNLPVRILILASQAAGGLVQRALQSGARGFVLKSSAPQELIEAIRRVAADRRAIRPELAQAAWNGPRDPLTDRQRTILRLTMEGRTNKEIARALQLSPGTVRNHLSEAASRLGVRTRFQAGLIARDNGWL